MTLPRHLPGPAAFEARWAVVRHYPGEVADLRDAAVALSQIADPLFESILEQELRWFWGWVAQSLPPSENGDHCRAFEWLRSIGQPFRNDICPYLDPLHGVESCPTCDIELPEIGRVPTFFDPEDPEDQEMDEDEKWIIGLIMV